MDNPSKVITVSINGESRQIPENSTIATLIDQLGQAGKRIAVERNGEIVARSAFGTQPLSEGDRLEIVVAVGGG